MHRPRHPRGRLSADLAAWRREHGLTQDVAAALLEVQVKTLQNWEQGRPSPAWLANYTRLVGEELRRTEGNRSA